jgi:hypothetical protein
MVMLVAQLHLLRLYLLLVAAVGKLGLELIVLVELAGRRKMQDLGLLALPL